MNTAATPVGVVGLGLVGSALGQRLTQAGFNVLGFDPRPEARAAWATQGLPVADTLTGLALCRTLVVLAVFDTAGVLQVVEGPGGLLDGGTPDLVVDFIEAPLSGSSQQIAAGQATALLGADAATLQRHAPPLTALGLRHVHVGGPGMGARAKLATNRVLGLNCAVLAEGMAFAERRGITPAVLLQLVLATTTRSDAALAKGPKMVADNDSPQSRIHQHLKDLHLMPAAAQAVGQGLPFTRTHAALLQAAVAAGDGDLDNAAALRQLRRTAP